MNSADRNASWRRPPVVSLAGAALLLLFAVPLPAVAQEPSSGSRVAEGARVYGNMCGRCHNPRSPLERDDRSWITIINHMRVRGNLTGGQVKDVLAFLQGTNNDPSQVSPIAAATGPTARHLGPSDAPINAELADRGAELVNARACLGCHVIAGQGGNVGPSLDGVVDRKGVEFVRHKLADPTFNNATSMMPNFGLSAEEIEAILAYLARQKDDSSN